MLENCIINLKNFVDFSYILSYTCHSYRNSSLVGILYFKKMRTLFGELSFILTIFPNPVGKYKKIYN